MKTHWSWWMLLGAFLSAVLAWVQAVQGWKRAMADTERWHERYLEAKQEPKPPLTSWGNQLELTGKDLKVSSWHRHVGVWDHRNETCWEEP